MSLRGRLAERHGAQRRPMHPPRSRPLPPLAPSPVTCPSPSPLYRALDREWESLTRRPDAVARARRWRLDLPTPLTSLDDVVLATGYGRVGTRDESADAVLRRLVELAADDPLAARVVLQRIVPGLRTLPRRRRVFGARLSELDDEVVGTAWTVIRTFPVGTRRHQIAAQLLDDVGYRVFRLPVRRISRFDPHPAATFAGLFAPDPEPDAGAELDELLATADRAGIDASCLALLRRFAEGSSTAELAREEQVTERMIRYRKRAAIERVRELALSGS